MQMRHRKAAFATAVLVLFSLLAAAAPKSSPNAAPVVQFTAPADGSQHPSGAGITLAADAYDPDGSISRVDFMANGKLLGRDNRAPYSLVWTGAAVGTHRIEAIAYDNRKASTTAAIQVHVVAATDTVAPTVPTGLRQSGATSSSISLQWDPSSDSGSGVAGYDVFRDGVLVATPATTAYTDNGLPADSAYAYTVRARDLAGNASMKSSPLIAATTPESAAGSARVAGYFTQWGIYTTGYTVKSLDTSGAASRLTHLNYAFGNVRENRCEVGVLEPVDPDTGKGGDAYADYSRTYTAAESVDGQADAWNQPLRGHWNQLAKLKARNPQLKVLISLGGWTLSGGFASAARPEKREAFVASCIDAYIRGNLPLFDNAGGPAAAYGLFDGFDIDWEYPAACGLTCGDSAESENFTALLAEFRRQLDAVRPGLLLTVAVGAGIDKIQATRPDLYHRSVDAINMMTYDFHGSWDDRTNFHSALFSSPNDPSTCDARYYNTNDAIQAMLDRGVPAHKLSLGIASYGRGWSGVADKDAGLYQKGKVVDGSLGPGVERYAVLAGLGWPTYQDANAMARWIYNGSTFWSFDDPKTIGDKMAYLRVQGLGGAFLWDFSGDDAQASLVRAMAAGAN
jgi:chitinase